MSQGVRGLATPGRLAPTSARKGVGTKDVANTNKDPVEVYCRLRPLRDANDPICVQKYNETTIKLTPVGVGKLVSFFTFRSVFPETTTQSELFQKVGFPLLKSLIHGKNGLLFTYGTTSSGKTFTLTGSPSECGVLPRTLDILFNSLDDSLCRKFTFSPDGSNGFKVRAPPDALIEWQKYKQVIRTPSATPARRAREKENDDLKEWKQRVRDATKIDLDSKGNGFAVFISYVEIYNNYIYDLLDDETFSDAFDRKQPQSKVLREDKRKKVFVYAAKEIEVHSSDEAFNLFVKGVRRRTKAHTALNTESSRSHSVFNIKLVQSPLDVDGEVVTDEKFVTISQLSLVDLAGSERTTRTQNTGDRLREAGNINNSLMNLRTCIELLRENQKSGAKKNIPYRDNKLTHLFKSYFEGEGKIKMIICVNPGAADFDETLHVMKFAETAQEVMINRAVDIPFHLKMPFPYASPKFIPFPKVDSSAAIIGPALPAFSSVDFKDKIQIANLVEILELRKKNCLRHFENLRARQMLFRENLVSVESEHMLSRQQLKIIRNDLKVREDQMKELESKNNLLESEQEEYLRKIYALEKNLREVEEKLDQKNQALDHADIQCELTKAATQEKIAREKDRLKRVFEKVLREKQAQLEREQCLTKEKMHLVKEILTADNSDWGVFREYWDTMYPNANPTTPNKPDTSNGQGGSGIIGGFSHYRRPSMPESTPRSTSTPEKASIPSCKRLKLSSEPGTSMMCTPSIIPNYEFATENNHETRTRTKSTNGIPVVNPRHIRSLSTGAEKWIDHRDQNELDMGTVLRPKIKNKKSITNLKDIEPDDLRRASKYAITTHITDEQGDIETRVYKGEVIPSCGGGAQVIFNDVETMIQSPPRK